VDCSPLQQHVSWNQASDEEEDREFGVAENQPNKDSACEDKLEEGQ